MQKIKIIHIITSLNYGGAEKMLLDLAKNLDKDRPRQGGEGIKGRGEGRVRGNFSTLPMAGVKKDRVKQKTAAMGSVEVYAKN